MLDVQIYPLGYCEESEYTRVVCVCKYKDKFVFTYNKVRKGWEIPGGHIEEGETWEDAIKREMKEEVGATKIDITPICVYKINSFALLCYGEIIKMEEFKGEYEISKIKFSNHLPHNLTYPDTYKKLFEIALEKMNIK